MQQPVNFLSLNDVTPLMGATAFAHMQTKMVAYGTQKTRQTNANFSQTKRFEDN